MMQMQPSLSDTAHPMAAPLNKPENFDAESHLIENRYGKVLVKPSQSIFFAKGLLGMPDMQDFCLANVPDGKLPQFKLLQSLNDESLAFIVLPLTTDTSLLEKKDIAECCDMHGIDSNNLVLLSIVSVHRSPEKVSLTANIRAPLVIDSERRLATQYVFPNNQYQIRHPLN